MSHSFTRENSPFIFHYNSDFSGPVDIVDVRDPGSLLRVPAEDILEFVAYAFVAHRRIGRIEEMDWRELLGAEEE